MEHPDARIPGLPDYESLNEKATFLIAKMARLSDAEQHDASRAAAMAAFKKIKSVSAGHVLKGLLQKIPTQNEFDWVEAVGKQLPARLISAGLGFDEADSNYVAENLQRLVGIMFPNKTEQNIELLNLVVDNIYNLAEKYARLAGLLTGEKGKDEEVICNMVGLFIQCYDGGRGFCATSY